jgi:hypothetical protein
MGRMNDLIEIERLPKQGHGMTLDEMASAVAGDL